MSGFYLHGKPAVTGWQKQALDDLMDGRQVEVTGTQFTDLYAFLGRVNQDPRKGNRQLDIKTGYQLASLILSDGQ